MLCIQNVIFRLGSEWDCDIFLWCSTGVNMVTNSTRAWGMCTGNVSRVAM